MYLCIFHIFKNIMIILNYIYIIYNLNYIYIMIENSAATGDINVLSDHINPPFQMVLSVSYIYIYDVYI